VDKSQDMEELLPLLCASGNSRQYQCTNNSNTLINT
jgi:hypothetical protein